MCTKLLILENETPAGLCKEVILEDFQRNALVILESWNESK